MVSATAITGSGTRMGIVNDKKRFGVRMIEKNDFLCNLLELENGGLRVRELT